MPPCKTSPALTPLQISLRSGIAAPAWLRAIDDLAGRLPPAPTRDALCASGAAVGRCLEQWIDDEDFSPDDTAQSFWRMMLQREPSLAAGLARALSAADRCLGRESFEESFLPHRNPSAR